MVATPAWLTVLAAPCFPAFALGMAASHAAAQNGELLETIDGVNTPLLKKYIADYLVDGVIDEDDVEAVGEGDEEED